MPDPDRIVDPFMLMPTHEQGMKECIVMTSTAVHTVTLSSGKSYAAIVHNEPKSPCGSAVFLNRPEAEALIALLNNALDDADRLNSGKPALARTEKGTMQ